MKRHPCPRHVVVKMWNSHRKEEMTHEAATAWGQQGHWVTVEWSLAALAIVGHRVTGGVVPNFKDNSQETGVNTKKVIVQKTGKLALKQISRELIYVSINILFLIKSISRKRGREGENIDVREKRWLVVSQTRSDQGQNPHPGLCPAQEWIELAAFCVAERHPTDWATPVSAEWTF